MTAKFVKSGVQREEHLAGLASMRESDRNTFLRLELELTALEATVVRAGLLKSFASHV